MNILRKFNLGSVFNGEEFGFFPYLSNKILFDVGPVSICIRVKKCINFSIILVVLTGLIS